MTYNGKLASYFRPTGISEFTGGGTLGSTGIGVMPEGGATGATGGLATGGAEVGIGGPWTGMVCVTSGTVGVEA